MIRKRGDLEVSSKPVVVDENSTSLQPDHSSSVYVIDEKEVSNNAVDAQDTEHLAASDPDRGNMEECSDLDKNNNHPSDASVAHNVASVTMPPITIPCDTANPVLLVQNLVLDPNIDVETYNGDQTKIAKKDLEDSIVAKKEYEDSIIKKARFIEVHLLCSTLISDSALLMRK
jgi:hypothetical protein